MHHIPAPLVLASQSPRRRALLQAAGFAFTVCPAGDNAEQGADPQMPPIEVVALYARRKAEDVASRIERGLVLACDTVAECEGQLLGKPRNRAHAEEMLHLLSGREHQVHSGLCLWLRPDDQQWACVDTSTLRMRPLDETQIDEYLDSGLWEGKAGGFGFQDGNDWLELVSGSESNVVGLPMERLAELLTQIGNTAD